MVKKAVISTQILPRKAVNRIQIFVIKTVSDSFDFAIKDIAGDLFTLEIQLFSKIIRVKSLCQEW